ncbi:MAG: HNH endonuclease [Firmicutes bacterium]|nr:HNH endonuclease [Bacillota bacterium]
MTILAFLFFAWSLRGRSAGTNRRFTRSDAQSPHTYKRTPIPKGVRWKVFARDNFTCQYCGRTPKKHGITLEIDHKIPVSKGGTNALENLVTSCSDCNRGKGASAYFG